MKSNILVLKLRNCTKKFCSALIYIHQEYIYKTYPILYESLRVEKTRKISR